VTPVTLREVRRGAAADELYLVDSEGKAVLLHAHGMNPDEQIRTRELALKLLSEGLAEGDPPR
jgi:hypothetical protein